MNLNEETERSMLLKIDPQPVWGEKCAHGAIQDNTGQTGRWAVKLGDEFYVFEPGTQLQKDIWLSTHDPRARSAERGEEDYIHQLKLGALRWYCAVCGTVQEP